MDTRRVRIQIRGKVQGVFFRQSAVDEATRLGLRGWVRNRRDGQVEALCEGPSDAIEAFIAWCHRGPPAADVDAVDVEDLPERPPLERFHMEPTA